MAPLIELLVASAAFTLFWVLWLGRARTWISAAGAQLRVGRLLIAATLIAVVRAAAYRWQAPRLIGPKGAELSLAVVVGLGLQAVCGVCLMFQAVIGAWRSPDTAAGLFWRR